MAKKQVWEGGCLCRSVRFRATGAPGFPHTCSCSQCRRHSGAPTLAGVEFPRDAVEWVGEGGTPATWWSLARSSRAFCPRCGSTLGAIDDAPVVALVVRAFDRPRLAALAPRSHSFRSARPRWWPLPETA
jgi:hypothetical protein